MQEPADKPAPTQPKGAQAEVLVYTLPFCPHCSRAKALLVRRGIQFREIDGAGTRNFRGSLVELTGASTVPQIVIDEHPVGGADTLARLDRAGVLSALVRREPFPVFVPRRRLTLASISAWIMSLARRGEHSPVMERTCVWLDRRGRVVEPPPAEADCPGGPTEAPRSILPA